MDTDPPIEQQTVSFQERLSVSSDSYAKASSDDNSYDPISLNSSLDPIQFSTTPQVSPVDIIREGKKSIIGFLSSHTAYDVMTESGKLIIFNENVPLRIVYNTMLNQNLQEALIWSSDLDIHIGIITSGDLLRQLLYNIETSEEKRTNFFEYSIRQWRNYLSRHEGEQFDLEKDSPSCSLYLILKTMAQSRRHHIPIIDDQSRNCIAILTYVDICSYLVNMYQETRRLFDISIIDAQIGTFNSIVTVKVTDRLYDALKIMSQRSLTSIPIVDVDGQVVSIIQRDDIFKFYSNPISAFSEPISNYLSYFQPFSPSLVCHPTDSIQRLFSMFADTRFPRLICVNEKNIPIGVVSLVDLFNYFIPCQTDPLNTSTIYSEQDKNAYTENTYSGNPYIRLYNQRNHGRYTNGNEPYQNGNFENEGANNHMNNYTGDPYYNGYNHAQMNPYYQANEYNNTNGVYPNELNNHSSAYYYNQPNPHANSEYNYYQNHPINIPNQSNTENYNIVIPNEGHHQGPVIPNDIYLNSYDFINIEANLNNRMNMPHQDNPQPMELHSQYHNHYVNDSIQGQNRSYPIVSTYSTRSSNSATNTLADRDPTQFISKSSRIN